MNVKQLLDTYRQEHGEYADEDLDCFKLLDIDPDSVTVDAEKCLALGQLSGYLWAGDDGFWRSAHPQDIAKQLIKAQAHDVKIRVAYDLLLAGYCMGIDERGG